MKSAHAVVAKNINTVVVESNINDIESQNLYIGIMSGTSLDGVDGVIYDFSTDTLIRSIFIPYDENIRNDLLSLAQPITLQKLINLELNLTNYYVDVVNKLLDDTKIANSRIKAIGLHGQTVYHEGKFFTKQLGLAEHVAYYTGITTINNFRAADILAGGEGAPLATKYHQYLLKENGIVVNLGGIANITKIVGRNVVGYDSGPANTLLNNYAQKFFAVDYDDNGDIAKKGKVLNKLLQKMLQDSYFTKKFPKSTGTDYFNLAWLDSFLTGREESQDVMRTLTELSARTISNEIDGDKAYFCGGGVNNSFLMARIKILTPNCEVCTTSDLGVDPNFIEAIAFAYLAKLHLEQKTANIKSVTGANKEMILGVKHNG